MGSVHYDSKDYDSTLYGLEQFILGQNDEDKKDSDFLIAGDLITRVGYWGYKEEVIENESPDNTKFERTAQDMTTNRNGRGVIEI